MFCTGMHNVGVTPCSPTLAGLQVWDFETKGVTPPPFQPPGVSLGQFVSGVRGPDGQRSCLARTVRRHVSSMRCSLSVVAESANKSTLPRFFIGVYIELDLLSSAILS